MNKTVSLFRDHPAEGWLSMERYANGLETGLAQIQSELDIRSLTPPVPWLGARGMLLRRMVSYPLWARQHPADVHHILDHSYGHLLFALPRKRSVVTIHDIAPLLFPGHRLGLSGLAWRLAWRGTLRAERMIAVSEFTRQEVLQRFSVRPDRIVTIPSAIESHFRPLSSFELEPYAQRYPAFNGSCILHVGSLAPRKNFERLLEALNQLLANKLKFTLYQVGGNPSPAQCAWIETNGLQSHIRFLGNIPDEELVALYNLANVFVFPSLYEGFGFPPLEAMACGTPVIASNAASLPEVTGDAAYLVDPFDSRSLADAIVQILTNPSLADDWKQKGLARARTFSWLRTAEETLNVYRQLIP